MRLTSAMEFRLLGPFEVWHDGRRIDIAAGQQLQVLVELLLKANRPVPRTQLATLLWPNPADRKTGGVATYVCRLNRLFKECGDAAGADVVIAAEPTGYVLRVEPDQVDYTRFGRLREQARNFLDADDSASARQAFREAYELHRGEFMAGLRPGVTELKTRQTLAEARLDVLGDLAELQLATNHHRWVRDHLQPAVRDHPTRQRLVALLMEALLTDDAPERAVEVYRRTAEALADSGMRPLRRLTDLALRAWHDQPQEHATSVHSERLRRDTELALRR